MMMFRREPVAAYAQLSGALYGALIVLEPGVRHDPATDHVFIAADEADLPQSQRRSREARQLVTVGDTYDFEIQPTLDQPLWLALRRGSGEWVAQVLLVARSDR